MIDVILEKNGSRIHSLISEELRSFQLSSCSTKSMAIFARGRWGLGNKRECEIESTLYRGSLFFLFLLQRLPLCTRGQSYLVQWIYGVDKRSFHSMIVLKKKKHHRKYCNGEACRSKIGNPNIGNKKPNYINIQKCWNIYCLLSKFNFYFKPFLGHFWI